MDPPNPERGVAEGNASVPDARHIGEALNGPIDVLNHAVGRIQAILGDELSEVVNVAFRPE